MCPAPGYNTVTMLVLFGGTMMYKATHRCVDAESSSRSLSLLYAVFVLFLRGVSPVLFLARVDFGRGLEWSHLVLGAAWLVFFR